MSIGDVNSNEKGSGARYNSGKPDLSLIPLCTLEDEARVWEYGKKKYAAWNWTKGMPWSVPFACLLRHLSAWQRGEECDEESGLPHLAHAHCNLRMLTLYSRTFKEGDDRPIKWFEEWIPKWAAELVTETAVSEAARTSIPFGSLSLGPADTNAHTVTDDADHPISFPQGNVGLSD